MNTTKYPVPDLFRAHVERVIDGDTVRLRMDLGFHVSTSIDLRVLDLNAPELSAPQGAACRDIVARLLPVDLEVLVESTQRRTFARYLGRILVAEVPTFTATTDLAPANISFKPFGRIQPRLFLADESAWWDLSDILVTDFPHYGFARP